jgi:hypothetical protein
MGYVRERVFSLKFYKSYIASDEPKVNLTKILHSCHHMYHESLLKRMPFINIPSLKCHLCCHIPGTSRRNHVYIINSY